MRCHRHPHIEMRRWRLLCLPPWQSTRAVGGSDNEMKGVCVCVRVCLCVVSVYVCHIIFFFRCAGNICLSVHFRKCFTKYVLDSLSPDKLFITLTLNSTDTLW